MGTASEAEMKVGRDAAKLRDNVAALRKVTTATNQLRDMVETLRVRYMLSPEEIVYMLADVLGEHSPKGQKWRAITFAVASIIAGPEADGDGHGI